MPAARMTKRMVRTSPDEVPHEEQEPDADDREDGVAGDVFGGLDLLQRRGADENEGDLDDLGRLEGEPTDLDPVVRAVLVRREYEPDGEEPDGNDFHGHLEFFHPVDVGEHPQEGDVQREAQGDRQELGEERTRAFARDHRESDAGQEERDELDGGTRFAQHERRGDRPAPLDEEVDRQDGGGKVVDAVFHEDDLSEGDQLEGGDQQHGGDPLEFDGIAADFDDVGVVKRRGFVDFDAI